MEGSIVIKVIVGVGTCGIAAGANDTLNAIIDEIKKVDKDKIEVVKSGCVGACYAEPTVEVRLDGEEPKLYGNVTPDIGRKIVNSCTDAKQEDLEEFLIDHPAKNQVRIALRNCGNIDPENIDHYIENNGYKSLEMCIKSLSQDELIDIVKKSGLKGRGGGGFLTGTKWEMARRAYSDQKYIICNADEGDPGAFMDRSVLEGDPHSVLEAMAIAGYAVGADKGYIYIRAEYPLAIKRLEIAIEQAKDKNLLGDNILGSNFSFNIFIKYGAGAFVCGEEMGLINSMEGNRGEPRNKPPFPSESGFLGKPTIVNNVETFANIPEIIFKGYEWFTSIGTEKSKGTKVFALAGKVDNVGLVEVPMGTTLREIVYDIGGGITGNRGFKAVQTGGPSGGCIPRQYLDTPIDYDNLQELGSMMGSGGMIVMDEDDCMVSIAKFYLEFSVEESCGKCTPCRVGNKRLFEILTRITEGQGSEQDIEDLKELGETIKDTALCGLGQTSPNPIISTIKYFEDEYIAHVKDKSCPAGVCTSLIKYIINDKCTGCTICARACPVDCISGELKGMHEIDQDKCTKCGICFSKCRFDAIDKI